MTIKSGHCALVCRVFWSWHSAKLRNFTECFSVVHSAKASSLCHPLTFFYREFIFAACLLTLGKPFAECAIKNTRQIAIRRHCRYRVVYAKCYTRQSLCRVLLALGVSRSETPLLASSSNGGNGSEAVWVIWNPYISENIVILLIYVSHSFLLWK